MPILVLVLALQAMVPGATSFVAIARYESARAAAATASACTWASELP